MTDTADPELPETPEKPTFSDLLGELSRDATNFARAEVDYLRAQAGERAHHAVPGLIMIGVAIALVSGVTMAVPVGLILLFAPLIGTGWAITVVSVTGVLIAVLLYHLGLRRMRTVLKRPEDR
jgi:Putative Actinobacterial Holin-X, holin superfamily III